MNVVICVVGVLAGLVISKLLEGPIVVRTDNKCEESKSRDIAEKALSENVKLKCKLSKYTRC